MSSRVRQPATAALRCARQAWKVQYNDTARSLALAEQALARALARSDVEAEGWARLTLGHYRLRYASPAEALVELAAAERCLSASGDRRGEIMAQVAQARCHWRQGQVLEPLNQVMAFRDEGMQVLNREERSMMLNVIAGCHSTRGDSPKAFAYLYQALRESHAARGHGFDVVLLCNLAHELLQLGDYYEALKYIDEGIERCRRMSNKHLLGVLLLNRVLCLTDLERPVEAMAEVARLSELLGETARADSVETCAVMALAALRARRISEAEQLIEMADAALTEETLAEEALALIIAHAELLRTQGEHEEAVTVLDAAEPLPAEALTLRARCLFFYTRAAALEELGDAERALADLRSWQALYQDRAMMASKGRYQAASLQTELLRLQKQRDESEARRRATERAKAELEAINGKLSQKVREVESLQTALQEQAVRDFLTGLYNRRYLNDVLPPMLALAQRHNEPLALAVIDLDHFKEVNDVYGHAAGDRVLASFGKLLRARMRRSDIACRYGGEEFCVLMPRTTALAAQTKLDQILKAWRSMRFDLGGKVLTGASFSVGIAESTTTPGSAETLLNAADDCALLAKRRGRGRVVVRVPPRPVAERELTP
ncbi:MAG TPA: diguanylate cyclase [Burkholderiaceae bacterium]|nr:diguanylate cyclase [Burkholderiaceae bacterium]